MPRMRLLLFLVSLSLPAASIHAQLVAPRWPRGKPTTWLQDLPCLGAPGPHGLRALPAPDSSLGSDCKSAHCLRLPDGRLLCSCATDSTIHFILEANEGRRIVWPAAFVRGYSTGDWRALQGDLDGDRRAELIIVNLSAWSNGMGVEYYQVAIFDGAAPWGPPLRFEVEEYGAHGSFTLAPKDGRCRVLTSSWENGNDRRRGSGSYFVGQWFRYLHGELIPDLGRPVLARRFLNSFDDERNHTPDADVRLSPYSWLIGPQTQRLQRMPSDPNSSTEDTLHATILDTRPDGIDVRTDHGDTTSYVADSWWLDGEPLDSSNYVTFGDLRSGRLYPSGYVPGVGNTLKARPILVVTYRGYRFSSLYRIIWLR